LSSDVSLKLGCSNRDALEIVDYLVKNELENFEKFAVDYPEVLLPTDLDVNHDLRDNFVAGEGNIVEEGNQGAPSRYIMVEKECETPVGSLKDLETSPSWSEVVRRGKHRIKTKSRSDKITINDRCLLGY
jgi:hypothetical protein